MGTKPKLNKVAGRRPQTLIDTRVGRAVPVGAPRQRLEGGEDT